MTGTKQVGWFVVGEGECGQYVFGTTFETMDCSEDTLKYWKSRGYDLVEALVPDDCRFEAFALPENHTC
jgi:hypothetical protein